MLPGFSAAYCYWIAAAHGGCAVFGSPVCLPTYNAVAYHAATAFASFAHLPAGAGARVWQVRAGILGEVLVHLLFWRPLFVSLFMVDEVLLTGWKHQRVIRPLFVMSGARSGSTTFGHILDHDPALCAPPMLFCVLPFLGVWAAISNTIGRIIPADAFGKWATDMSPEELRVRHEANLMKPDTYDGPFAMRQWWGLVMFQAMLAHPRTQARIFWYDIPKDEQDRAVAMMDETARKWLWWNNADAEGQTLLIKGHQVCMVEALKAKYTDAAFITVLRDPVDMVRSIIPFSDAQGAPSAGMPRAIHFPWFNYVCQTYYDQYCRAELALVSGDAPKVLGIPFMKVIKDQAAAMQVANDWVASQWGMEPVQYRGSAHEAAVDAEQQDPDHTAVKKWRKSLKGKYPSQSAERMQAMADEYTASAGLPRFSTDDAFKAYRQHTDATLARYSSEP